MRDAPTTEELLARLVATIRAEIHESEDVGEAAHRAAAERAARAAMTALRTYGRIAEPLTDRLMRYVEPALDGCWNWTGGVNLKNYARVNFGGRNLSAHRMSYEVFVGPIAEGLTIDHLCRNRLCINPAHLEPVTHRENVMRSDGIGAVNSRKTHCKRGHALTLENTYTSQGRVCITCSKAYGRARRAKLRPQYPIFHGAVCLVADCEADAGARSGLCRYHSRALWFRRQKEPGWYYPCHSAPRPAVTRSSRPGSAGGATLFCTSA